MKIRSVQTTDVVEMNDEGARILIAAGIYVAVEDEPEPQADELPRKHKPHR